MVMEDSERLFDKVDAAAPRKATLATQLLRVTDASKRSRFYASLPPVSYTAEYVHCANRPTPASIVDSSPVDRVLERSKREPRGKRRCPRCKLPSTDPEAV